jgi:hypothetical protein
MSPGFIHQTSHRLIFAVGCARSPVADEAGLRDDHIGPAPEPMASSGPANPTVTGGAVRGVLDPACVGVDAVEWSSPSDSERVTRGGWT